MILCYITVGDPQHSPDAILELLTTRSELLVILDSDAYEKRELVEILDLSRSTIDRALRDLETAALVQQTNGRYRTTFYGRALQAVYDSFLESLEQVLRAKSLLELLPPNIAFDFALLWDAELCIAEEPALHVPATRLRALLEEATHFKGLAYAHTSSTAQDVIREQIIRGETTAEIVFRREMYQYLANTYPEFMQSLVSTEQFTGFQTDGIPFGLFLFEIQDSKHVCLVVYRADQTLKGILVNDDPAAVRWGEEVYEQYQANATRIDAEPDLS